MNRVFFLIITIATAYNLSAQEVSDCIRIAETDSAVFVVNCNGKFGIYDELNEQFLIKPKFELIDAKNFSKEGYVRVKQKGKWGVYDTYGGEYIKIAYDSIGNLFEYPDAYILIKHNGKLGLLSEGGYEIFKPKYDSIGKFGNYGSDRALVKLNGFYGLISTEGYEFLPPVYDYIEQESKYIELCIRVRKNGLWGVVPNEGYSFPPKTLSPKSNKSEVRPYQGYGLPAEYEELRPLGEVHPAFAIIKRNGKLGLMNSYLQVMVPCEMDNIDPFGKMDDNCAILSKGGKLGMIDLEGNITLAPEYESIKKVADNIFEISKAGYVSYVDVWGYEVDKPLKN